MSPSTKRHRAALPFLYYEDVAGALTWLCSAFGFEERVRLELPGGFIAHAELAIADAVVMVGNIGARNAGPSPGTVRSGVYIFVDDVDGHCGDARRSGAEIVDEPADQPYGDRIYLALDPEGHEWYFAQHVQDVDIDDLGRQLGGAR
jgi:uncharacterized glyoxalase superfamily protein PhnB